MPAIRKRLNAKRRRTGFVPSKPWTPRPTLTELLARMRTNMRADVKSLVPVHEAFAKMREGLKDIRIPTFFKPRTGTWAKELQEFMAHPTQPRYIAISSPSANPERDERFFRNDKDTGWETITVNAPHAKELAETLRDFKQQPTDTLVLTPALYDVVAKSSEQPVVSFDDGQAITVAIDSAYRGTDETAGMIVRRHPNGDMEILKRFQVARDKTN